MLKQYRKIQCMLVTIRFQVIVVFLSCLCFNQLYAQGGILDSLVVQHKTQKQGLKNLFKYEGEPSPKRATILSLALPGAGQIYNRKWWKVPIVYAALGTTVYFVVDNSKNYKDFRDALTAELAGEQHQYSNTNLSSADLRRIRNLYRKDMERSYIALVFVYLLNGVDAFVDAHLAGFNVSEDLSFKIDFKTNQHYMGFTNGSIPTLGLQYELSAKNKKLPKSYSFPY